MVNCGSLWKCALVAIVLVAVVESTAEKLASCCTMVSNEELTGPILGFMVQKRNLPCVAAVIFQTKSELFCSNLNAPWVKSKIFELRRAKAQSTTPSTVSLLSIITSTASPPSSSAPPPSSVETFSEGSSEQARTISTPS